jgi:hypothetical protein
MGEHEGKKRMISLYLLFAIAAKIEVNFAGKLGIFYEHVAGTSFKLKDLDLDCASITLDANFQSKADAEIDADFSKGIKLKTARLRFDPLEFLSIRLGQQEIPFIRSRSISYLKRDFFKCTWGSKWADNKDFAGREMGVIIKGRIPLGKLEITPISSAFSSSKGITLGTSRVAIGYDNHQLALAYSSRGSLFNPDSLMWAADMHLEFPVACDAEAIVCPSMTSISVSVSTSFANGHLKPAIRYEWFDDLDDLDRPTQDIYLGLSWLSGKNVLIHTELSVPMIKETTPVRLVAGVKAEF